MSFLLLKLGLAYLLGSLMGGALVGRCRGGADLRRLGSGNLGATNALRTQGKGFALLVLLIDAGKGAAAVLLVPLLPSAADVVLPVQWQAYLCGIAVSLGHCYPVFHRFAGGKAVATLAGVYGVLLPESLLVMLTGFVLVAVLSGYVSLASLSAALVAILDVLLREGYAWDSATAVFVVSTSALVFWRHRHNLWRLWMGNESRFRRPWQRPPT